MPRFVKRIPMNAHAALRLGRLLGGGKLDIDATGSMLMEFKPASDNRPWHIRILGVHLAWKPFQLPLPGGKHVSVEGFRVSNADFDLERSYGTLEPESGKVLLHLEIRLTPHRIPQLRALGVNTMLPVVVEEEGTMDFVHGRIIQTHAKTFRIPSNLPEGLMEVRAGQNSCEATGDLFVGIAGVANQELVERYKPTYVRICPGTQIVLGWVINNYAKVSSAFIEAPGQPNINVGSSTGATNPIGGLMSDTTFKLHVKDTGGCEATDTVDVYVVKPGTKIDIQAQHTSGPIWSVQLPAIQNDPKILVTSIWSNLCFGGDSAYADWGCYKTDLDGTVHAINLTAAATPMQPVPLAGLWEFSPLNTGRLITAPNYDPEYDRVPPSEENLACFTATIACR